MLLLYDKELTNLEMAKAMRNRARNEVTELLINNLYLEGLKGRQTSEKTAAELQQQIRSNQRAMEENKEHIAFLDRAVADFEKAK